MKSFRCLLQIWKCPGRHTCDFFIDSAFFGKPFLSQSKEIILHREVKLQKMVISFYSPLEQALGIYSEAQPEWQTAEWLLCTYQLKCQVRQTEINSVTLSRRLNNRDVGRKNHWGVWKGTNEVNLKGGDCSNVGTISFWIPNWFFMAKIKQEQRLESNTVRARPIWLILSANSSFAGSAFITDVKWKF